MNNEYIILYVIDKLKDNKQPNSTTRLMKLLYLIDLVQIKKLHKKITSFNYYYETFGPVIYDFIRIMKKLVDDGILKDTIVATRFGGSHDYRPNKKYSVVFDTDEEEIIDKILKLYGNMELGKLVDIIYSTNPMKHHALGDLLL